MTEVSLLMTVAKLYYIENLKQEEIAEKLQISRSYVSKILTEAKDEGIVEIRYCIKDPEENNAELSQLFQKRFSLKSCNVVPSFTQKDDVLLKLISQRMASLFNLIVKDNDIIGLGWGNTCYTFIENFKANNNVKDIIVLPLIGISDSQHAHYHVNDFVRKFSILNKGMPIFVLTPAYAATKEDKYLFDQISTVKEIVGYWEKLDIAIISSGVLPGKNKPPEDLLQILKKKQYYTDNPKLPVADLCGQKINIFGDIIYDETSERLIAVSLNQLKMAKRVICAVGGLNKVFTTLAALRSDTITDLIIDEFTARHVAQLI